ncbi:hypothetical protein GR247_38340 [Rhizobium leguminosarum]|uniref:Uncharacterized protein n=1 Tax=Rhizobium leguminosarum TaxID=384 RepID=A0A6P0C7D6_RHILE|nr:hypothetical protein [Rhizobium leguminosarum]NEJ25882.1 hypothetical protein [Rhizobium leguminosarum]NEK54891.1 hypothetical protein [Rhizobium leguminosarum]
MIESTLTHLPKHVRWQYERIGNGEKPIYRFGLQKRRQLFNAPYTRDLGASRPLCEYYVTGEGRTNDVAHLNCQLSAADSERTTSNNDTGGDRSRRRIHALIAWSAGTPARRRCLMGHNCILMVYLAMASLFRQDGIEELFRIVNNQ